MIKVFTISSEEQSARKLGFETFTHVEGYTEDQDKNICIRWGNSGRTYSKDGSVKDFKNVLNKAESIRTNCVKDKALALLSKVVSVPTLFRAGDLVTKGCDIIYRPIEHTAGNNFRLIKGGNFRIESGMYGKEYIENNKEWRVFFAGNQVMGCLRYKHKESLDSICKSLWSYDFLRMPESLKEECHKAKEVLNLDFGCWDIIEKNKKYFWLEGNTACTIDHSAILKFFKSGLERIMKERFSYLI